MIQIEKLKNRYIKFWIPSIKKEWENRTKYIFNDPYRPVIDNTVNLFWSGTYKGKITDHENLGDYLSLIIVQFLLKEKGIDLQEKTEKTYFLYAIGSIIGFGYQDATIWGSGLLNEKIALRCLRQTLDIRCVRGPCTRNILNHYGIPCPEMYGDPGCLLPRYFYPQVKKEWKYSLILHHNSELRKNDNFKRYIEKRKIHYIEILTTDYETFVKEILASEYIISSALHGIILGESYGVPVIFLREELNQNIKFDDWYFSTGRMQYFYITHIEEMADTYANPLPDLYAMQKNLISKFPYDLWE